jgi:hypothetical protein
MNRSPSPVSCHSERGRSPAATTGAGRRCSPRESHTAETANVAASISSAADGSSTATSAPAARNPTTWANCSVTLVSVVATA